MCMHACYNYIERIVALQLKNSAIEIRRLEFLCLFARLATNTTASFKNSLLDKGTNFKCAIWESFQVGVPYDNVHTVL